MRYRPPLAWGTLLRRDRRFLADVRLDDGRTVTAHVPNSGAMTGCSAPGSRCLVSPADRPGRTLAWTLEQVIASGVPVGVHTGRTNRLAEEALENGVVRFAGLGRSFRLRREVKLGERSRADFLLEDGRGGFWLEVKSVTWVEGRTALFPDAVTARGTRHLHELAARVAAGERAALLFVVQRGDAVRVQAAPSVDPTYAEALTAAAAAGVEVRAVQAAVAPGALVPWRELDVETGGGRAATRPARR